MEETLSSRPSATLANMASKGTVKPQTNIVARQANPYPSLKDSAIQVLYKELQSTCFHTFLVYIQFKYLAYLLIFPGLWMASNYFGSLCL